MRMLLTPAVFGLAIVGQGCSFTESIRRNIVHEPILACDEFQIRNRNRAIGGEAFAVMVSQYGCDFSDDYRSGFVDGFTDYLTYGGCLSGGCGEKPIVPPVPPSRYQRKQYMTPQGYQAMEDWFAGFRHGATTAQASGLRQLNVLPVIDAPRFGPDDAMKADYRPTASIPGGQGGEPPLGGGPGNSGSTGPDAGTLPAPRTLPGPDATPPATTPPAATPPAATPNVQPGVPPAASANPVPTPPVVPPMAVPPTTKPAEHPF